MEATIICSRGYRDNGKENGNYYHAQDWLQVWRGLGPGRGFKASALRDLYSQCISGIAETRATLISAFADLKHAPLPLCQQGTRKTLDMKLNNPIVVSIFFSSLPI